MKPNKHSVRMKTWEGIQTNYWLRQFAFADSSFTSHLILNMKQQIKSTIEDRNFLWIKLEKIVRLCKFLK